MMYNNVISRRRQKASLVSHYAFCRWWISALGELVQSNING